MAKDRKAREIYSDDIGKVNGNSDGRYVVKWTEVEIVRTRRSKTSNSEEVLRRFSEELKKRPYRANISRGISVAGNEGSAKANGDGDNFYIKLDELPEFGDAVFFKKALGDAAKAAHRAARYGDKDGLSVVNQYAKIIGEIGRVFTHYDDALKTEGELEKLIKFHESTRKTSMREGAASKVEKGGIAPALSGRKDFHQLKKK